MINKHICICQSFKETKYLRSALEVGGSTEEEHTVYDSACVFFSMFVCVLFVNDLFPVNIKATIKVTQTLFA